MKKTEDFELQELAQHCKISKRQKTLIIMSLLSA